MDALNTMPTPPSTLLPDFDLRELENLHGSTTAGVSYDAVGPAGSLVGWVQDAVAHAAQPDELTDTPPRPLPTRPNKATPPENTGTQPAVSLPPSTSIPSENVLLEALHQQYLRRLRDPNHTDDDAAASAWAPRAEPSDRPSHADPFLDLMVRAGTAKSLDEMMVETPNSDQLLACFDRHTGQDVLAPAEHDAVMHLLAPPEFTAPARDDALADWVADLPVLTRREHHGMTLDSAMELGKHTRRIDPSFADFPINPTPATQPPKRP